MKLIILDRDGVINEDVAGYVKKTEEWRPIKGSIEAIAQLYHANWRIVIASNQSAIGRKLMTVEQLYQIHAEMQHLLLCLGATVEGLFFCPHSPTAGCECRKPEPGLLHNIAKRFHTGLTDVPFVGDTMKDIKAAEQVGAKPYLVLTGQGEKTRAEAGPEHVEIYDNLLGVAEMLISREQAA